LEEAIRSVYYVKLQSGFSKEIFLQNKSPKKIPKLNNTEITFENMDLKYKIPFDQISGIRKSFRFNNLIKGESGWNEIDYKKSM
jgi:hypothetical protein